MAIDKSKVWGFMPGCSLPSYNPQAVVKTVEWLSTLFPHFAAVQKCCGKPTKAVGQHDLFEQRFQGLDDDMEELGVTDMISACQNCYMNLKKFSKTAKGHSLWTLMPELGLPPGRENIAKDSDIVMTIHDSCPTRCDSELHDGVRWTLKALGYTVVESERSRENTRCCGFGGMVVPVNPAVARKVMEKRLETLESENIVAYCAACRSSLVKVGGRSWHLLDLLWGPVITTSDPAPPDVLASPFKSWVNRRKASQGMKRAIQ